MASTSETGHNKNVANFSPRYRPIPIASQKNKK